MQQPQRDARGVIPHNHDEIAQDDQLVRYIPSVHVDYRNGERKLSSAAFSPSTPPDDPRSSVSVDVKNLLLQAGLAVPFRANAQQGLAELHVQPVRDLGLQVGWDPEEDNAAHGAIWGLGSVGVNQRKRLMRKLSDIAQVVQYPPQP